jgi:large subunit ribosomal protein L9
MKVILSRDVPKLGKGGELVEVKDGYARNYLLPRNYAVAATGGAVKAWAALREREKEREAKKHDEAKAAAEKLKDVELQIIARAGTGTRLFGSVTVADVAEKIKEACGVDVDKRRIGLLEPIKNLGNYRIQVRLHSEYVVQLPLEVVTTEILEHRKAHAAAAAARAAAAEASAPAAPAAEDVEDDEEGVDAEG